MAGDGNFKWWYGYGQDPKSYMGPCDTREEAIATLRNSGGGTIVEADKAIATSYIFDIDDVMQRFVEANEECWGEDGCETNHTREQSNELENMLGAALEAWFEKYPAAKPEVWNFGTERNREYIAPKEET